MFNFSKVLSTLSQVNRTSQGRFWKNKSREGIAKISFQIFGLYAISAAGIYNSAYRQNAAQAKRRP
jgi:hypothetical protein